MRRKFELKVCYTFNGCFTLRAASGKEAARLVSVPNTKLLLV